MRKYIPEAYVDWIRYDILKNKTYDPYRYEKLIYTLLGIKFIPYDEMDTNRISDAKYLRYRFANVRHLDDKVVDTALMNFGCSVLEMMVALAIRLYEETTRGFPIEIKPDELFWNMIESMHLENQTDSEFNEKKVIFTVERMMVHDFAKNGDGGLFRISKDDSRDVRTVDIWYQAQWWATEAWRNMTST